MAYVALNPAVFLAAYAGALAGMGVSGPDIDSASATYTDVATVAGAFAQQVDTVWGARATTELDVELIGQACKSVWDGRFALADATTILPATYADTVTGLIAVVTAARAYMASISVSPTPIGSSFRARNVVNGNIANLAAYTVASNAAVNDATLNVAGDIVLLVAQTTPAQNGLYVVGTVAAGVAPLTRLASMASTLVFVTDAFNVAIGAGTIFAHTEWFNSAGGTIGTNDPAFFPRKVTFSRGLTNGTFTFADIPILSATKSNILISRTTANTSVATDGGYCPTVGGASGITPGALGTATVTIEACVLAGTINNADVSTLNVTVLN